MKLLELTPRGAHGLRPITAEELFDFDRMKEPFYLVREKGLVRSLGCREQTCPAKFTMHANQYWVNTDVVKRFVVALKAIGFEPACEIEGPDHSFKYIFEFWFDISTRKAHAYYAIGTGSRGDVLPAIYTKHLDMAIVTNAKVVDVLLHRIMTKAVNRA